MARDELFEAREKAGGHNALFYALHAFNPATAMGRKAHELLPKIHNFCVWRVLNPELDHNKRPERVYGVATRAQQRMMSAAVTLEAYLCVLADALQARDPGLLQTMILSIHNLIGFAEQNPSLFRGGGNGKRMAPTELSEYATKLAQALERRRTASDRDLGIGWTEERKLEAGKAVIALRDTTVHRSTTTPRCGSSSSTAPTRPRRATRRSASRAVYDWSAHAPMLAMVFDPTDVASRPRTRWPRRVRAARVHRRLAHRVQEHQGHFEDAIVDEFVAPRARFVQHALREAFVVAGPAPARRLDRRLRQGGDSGARTTRSRSS